MSRKLAGGLLRNIQELPLLAACNLIETMADKSAGNPAIMPIHFL